MHIYICAYICIYMYVPGSSSTNYVWTNFHNTERFEELEKFMFKIFKVLILLSRLTIYRRILGDEIFEFRRLRMKNLGRRNISVSSPKDKKLRRRNKYLRRRNIVSSP